MDHHNATAAATQNIRNWQAIQDAERAAGIDAWENASQELRENITAEATKYLAGDLSCIGLATPLQPCERLAVTLSEV